MTHLVFPLTTEKKDNGRNDFGRSLAGACNDSSVTRPNTAARRSTATQKYEGIITLSMRAEMFPPWTVSPEVRRRTPWCQTTCFCRNNGNTIPLCALG